ncbi:MAG: formate dehydrogenase accessory sulfurtransferase FdhD [Hyphomonas sp.]|uniref:formate dehydrogenase accessory sulfurtransferase FdhD n=1 Tax=Hyphomonas sp. TaxID=87 RepID=UPI00183200AF|nr:formate dehydrogenase accessory sulfurtransferase FdhD [Hyphomonas sp.]MBA3066944.1 formate dehydrogenase accessory sulfurtransferase FdhD [Hyphomonas sp.]MBU4060552.1 formate dehydrogenase accessory sulfurtransferase FdhD [Alphaproteobacteria bacterium]MBU4165820.1 formate dehydrogenase accessory sulfurtransferase FdhD [Alphaproteobacteria bacterium]
MTRQTHEPASVTEIFPDAHKRGTRNIPIEAPISLEFNGIGYAVMMATPADLEDFASGFALSERIVRSVSEIDSIDIHQTEKGWIVRIRINAQLSQPLLERVRTRVSESSCGICGLENLDLVARPLPKVTAAAEIADGALFKALAALRGHQPLNQATGGTHAAAFCSPAGEILRAREDVGRHNALDKLIGALARSGLQPTDGFFLLSSRCSYELVEKTAVAGCPVLVTISTATSLAVSRAREAGLRLITLARPDSMLEFLPGL